MPRGVLPARRVEWSLESSGRRRDWLRRVRPLSRPPAVAFALSVSVAFVSPIPGHDEAWPFRASDG